MQPATKIEPYAAEPPAAAPLALEFNRRRVLRTIVIACVLAEFAFIALDYFVNYSRGVETVYVRRLFNITREDGLASWFAIMQTFLSALTIWAIWIVTRSTVSRSTRLGWLVLALAFTYMAIDDGAAIHERMGSTLKQVRDTEAPGAFPSYSWQIIFVPVFALLGLFMLGFLLRQMTTKWRRLAVVIALGCMAGAVALDFVEGLKPDHAWNVHTMIVDRFDFARFAEDRFDQSEFDTVVHFSKSLEEALEMFAMTLLWTAFLSHLMRLARDVRVRFTSDAETAPSA